jgi:RalA-binding protein 1
MYYSIIVVPETLLTTELSSKFTSVFSGRGDIAFNDSDILTLNHPILTDSVILEKVKMLVDLLPQENRDFLAVLFQHLKIIASNFEINKMGLNNLAVVWSPTIQFGGGLFYFLIYHSQYLFSASETSLENPFDDENEIPIPRRESSVGQKFSEAVYTKKHQSVNADDLLDLYPEVVDEENHANPANSRISEKFGVVDFAQEPKNPVYSSDDSDANNRESFYSDYGSSDGESGSKIIIPPRTDSGNMMEMPEFKKLIFSPKQSGNYSDLPPPKPPRRTT